MLLPLPLLEIKPAILEGRAINSKSLAVNEQCGRGNASFICLMVADGFKGDASFFGKLPAR